MALFIFSFSQIDAINGIVVETRTNAEWGDDSLVEYKSPGKYLSVQYHDDNSYYCVEKMLEGTSPQTPVRQTLGYTNAHTGSAPFKSKEKNECASCTGVGTYIIMMEDSNYIIT